MKKKYIEPILYFEDVISENFISLIDCLISEEEREMMKIKEFIEECRKADIKNFYGGYIPNRKY